MYEPLTAAAGEEERPCLVPCTSPRERALAISAGAAALLAGMMIITVALVHMEYSDAHRHVEELQKLCATTAAPATGSTGQHVDAVCSSPGCVTAAARLLSAMDATVDPCQDFYQYACGRWSTVHPRPSELPSWTVFGLTARTLRAQLGSTLLSREPDHLAGAAGAARRTYQRCVNNTSRDVTGVSPLSSALARLGGWPAVMELAGQWAGQNYSWQTAVVLSALYIGAESGTPLINLNVVADERNATRHLLHVDQPVLGLPRGILTDPDTHAAVHAAYERLIADTITMMYASEHGSTNQNTSNHDATNENTFEYRSTNQTVLSAAAAAATEVRLFEAELAELTVADEDRRNSSRMYNRMGLRQLQRLTDRVQPDTILWTELVGLFLALGNTSSSAPADDLEVVVLETEFLTNLTHLLNNTDKRIVANYIGWRVALSALSETDSKAGELLFQFEKILSGKQSPTPAEVRCFDWLKDVMGPAISYIYITNFFPEGRKEKVAAIASDVRTAFSQRLENITWMDGNTLHRAKDKLEQMVANVAYPNWMTNASALDHYFQDFEVHPGHFDNYVRLNQLEIRRNVGLLSKPADRTKFVGYPSEVNAFYEPTANSINIPAAILQSNFYGDGLQVLNYGAVGTVLGHEVTHGFDDFGRQYDAQGGLSQWWSADTLAEFQRRADCVVQQFSNFTLPQLEGLMNDTHVNGRLTVGENIADGGGLARAHEAYFGQYLVRHGPEPALPALDHLSANKLFFIAFAQLWCTSDTPEFLRDRLLTDPHSPRRLRVLGTVSNSAAFAAAFSCPAGAPMNPEHKCVVW